MPGSEERMSRADSSVPIELDARQRAVLDLPAQASALVLGAPGTGKTTALVELVADRIRRLGWRPEQVLVLTSSRVAATRLRDRLALRVARPTTGPLARTVNSLAFDIVGSAARVDGDPSPTLITGGEQDSDLAALLEGHLEDGTGPRWPEHLGPEVRRARGFRTELRDLMMRATEHGISAQHLRELGARHGRDEWIAAAELVAEYRNVLGLQRPNQYDSTELIERAIREVRRGRPGDIAASLRLVLVDDAQEATVSDIGLLAALAASGVAVVAFGNPDTGANAFRGADAGWLGRLPQELGVPAQRIELGTAHRQGPLLTRLVSAVTSHIGTAGMTGQRRADPAGDGGTIAVVQAPTPARERSALARRLRERHLVSGVPWREMAIVVRSGAQVPAVARALSLAEVPTRTTLAARPLRDDGAARSLLTLVDVGMGRSPLDSETATALLLGPFGGLDRLDLRRLRLALRAEELAGGGDRAAEQLLVEALEAPGRFATIDHRSGRRAERLSATLAALAEAHRDDATIEELLWLAWERSELPRTWHREAMGAGILAAEANRNLDGIVAVFSAAKRFVEREPGRPPGAFLDEVLDADVPEDTLSPQARGDSVLVTTPSGVVGLEFDTVAVAGLQDGVWPNLRIRGTLLGAQHLGRLAAGEQAAILDERRLVRDDELRMFALTVSRARTHVVLCATANDDEAPSVLFSLVPDGAERIDASFPVPLSLRGVTGRLRHELAHSSVSVTARDAAAAALARLADDHVPGADPATWLGLIPASSDEPLFGEEGPVPVSPSRLAAFEESPLDWFIDTICGSKPNTAMSIGTIIHWAMETSDDTSVDGVWSAIESRWHELVFEAPWLADKERTATRVLAGAVAEYLGDFVRAGNQLVGAEKDFELDVGRARVRGSIDRVERSVDGGVTIVDLKTGTPITKQTEIDEHPQLLAYQLAYAEGRLDEALAPLGEHRAAGAKLLFVKEGVRGKSYREGAQAAVTDEQLEEFKERLALAARAMAAAEFTALREVDDRKPGAAARRLHRVRAITSD